MPAHLVSRAEQYRTIARTLRAFAQEAKDPRAQSKLVDIADDLDWLAYCAEKDLLDN